jgi:hypothetical protein
MTEPSSGQQAQDLDRQLAAIGPQLAALRRATGQTLARVAERTGIGISTLSASRPATVGRMRLRLADTVIELAVGDAAEFDTRTPHWFGTATDHPQRPSSCSVSQGERVHLRARTTRTPGPA